MKEYKFDSAEHQRMGQYLIEALKDENLLTESLYRSAILKESMSTGMMALTENENAHAVETRDTYAFQGVTVTRDAFRVVYTDYDKYPNAESMLYGLGFPASYRSADESTLNKRIKKLVKWYNNNTKVEAGNGSNPANTLQTSLHQRKRVYSFKSREENSRKAKGYATTRSGAVVAAKDPTVEDNIDGGRNGRRTALSRSVDQVNSSELIDGTFYNDRTKIPQRAWANWVRFWDKRKTSVRPNRRSLLGQFFGMTWKKTFILGYSVNNNTAYEIWYNSYDSTFSIYDRNGVDVTRPISTVQESIKSLIHIIAQQGEGDIDAVAAGGTNNDTVRSMMRGLSTGLDKDMDVIKRQDELTRHEAMRLKREKEDAEREKEQESNGGKYSVTNVAKQTGAAVNKARGAVAKAASDGAERAKTNREANALGADYARLEKEQSKLQAEKARLNEKLRGETVGSDAYQKIRDKMFEVRQKITQVNLEMQVVKSKFPEGFSYADYSRKQKNTRDWDRNVTRDSEMEDVFGKFSDERDPEVDKAAERRIKALRRANAANAASPSNNAEMDQSGQRAKLSQEIAQTTQEMEMTAREREIALANAKIVDGSAYATVAGGSPQPLSQLTNGLYQKVYGTSNIPSIDMIDWYDYALKLDKHLKASHADYKKTIRQNNAEALAAEFGTTDSVPEMKKKAANGKYGLGDRFNVLRRTNEAVDPFSMGHTGEVEKPNEEFEKIPQIDDRKVDPQVQRARDQAVRSPYTQNLLKTDVAGSLTMYQQTKVPTETLTRKFFSAIQGNLGFLRGRQAGVESPDFGLWNRFKMSLRNQYYRSDFVIGFNLSNAIDIEVWYVTEPDPNNPKTTLSSYYVYDVNAQKMIRKYAPYYRTALMVVVAKLGVKLGDTPAARPVARPVVKF